MVLPDRTLSGDHSCTCKPWILLVNFKHFVMFAKNNFQMKELYLLLTIASLLTLGLLCYPLMCKRFSLSRDQLIAVAPNAKHLPHQTYKHLTLHGINRYPGTKKGARAGCQKQRHIKVLSHLQMITQASSQFAVYPKTLTPVQYVNLQDFKTLPNTYHLNIQSYY